jgi:hypothetical protein
VRVQPPTRYADEFYDLDARLLTLPSGPDGQKVASWWKSASAEDKREALHAARDVGLVEALFPTEDSLPQSSFDDLVETDDDDEDIAYVEAFAGDPDEYEEDYV